jgi:hypothetical protein
MDDYDVVSIQSPTDVTLEHIVFDGNHKARLSAQRFPGQRRLSGGPLG